MNCYTWYLWWYGDLENQWICVDHWIFAAIQNALPDWILLTLGFWLFIFFIIVLFRLIENAS